MVDTIKRWAEAIAQNLVAALLFVAGAALVAYLLVSADKPVTVHIWWLAVALAVLLALVGWLVWLTAQVRRLRGVRSTALSPAAPPAHPHQDLLDRMDAMIEQLMAYESHEAVSWQTGQAYNELMDEARAVDQRLNLRVLPVATEVAMFSGPSTTDPAPRELAGGLKQARIHVVRAQK